MIFNEIEYQNLVMKKLALFTDKQSKKYVEGNEDPVIFTPLTEETKKIVYEVNQGLMKEEDIPTHIAEELEKADKEREEYTSRVLNGEVNFPITSKEELAELLPTIEEIIKLATVSIEDITSKIKESQKNG